MTSSDPWRDLARPVEKDNVNARRVPGTAKWDLFWGIDADGRCLLLLHHNAEATPKGRLPHLKELDVVVNRVGTQGRPSLILRLLDSGARDVFAELCADIIRCVATAATEYDAVAAAIARTWRWHRLLRGGGTGLLSSEEQKGLLGELLVFERYFIPLLSVPAAVDAWRGPLGAPQDFLVSGLGVESKARSTATAGEILVSSEFQLETSNLDSLFLHVSVLDSVEPDTEGAFTLTDVTERLRQRIASFDGIALERFDALLMAAGVEPSDDYNGHFWAGSERGIYRIADGFPRLTPSSINSALSRVMYAISLAGCGAFIVPSAQLEQAIRETRSVG